MDAIILSSPPAASPFAAAGRAPRSRGCIAVLVFALAGSLAGFAATLRWSYGRTPLPPRTFLLATLPPGTRLPDDAPPIWRDAKRTLRPSIVGYAIDTDGSPEAFALQMQAPWGVPGNRTGWRTAGVEGDGSPTPAKLGPSFSLSRWRSAWLRVDLAGERLQGPLKDDTWTLDTPMMEGFTSPESAFQYTALLALPGTADALKELGIGILPGNGRVSWSIGPNGTLSALKIETADELATSTVASVLATLSGTDAASSTRAAVATTSRSIAWNDPNDLPAIPESCPGELVARLPVSALDGWIPWRPQGTTLSIASSMAQTSFCWK